KMLSLNNLKSNIEYLKIISKHFNNTLQYRQFIPCFFDEWSFTLGSNGIVLNNIINDKILSNYNELKVKPAYYSPSYHHNILHQPKIIEDLVSCIGSKCRT
ncbi:MAG: hypothetical protein ACFE9R_10750, partial [Candidatus Hermodarchaeota archaeon]